MTTPVLILSPRRPALLAEHENVLDVLVRVQAPVAPASQPVRNPLHLALVIDRSGSMAGNPLDEAKRCAEFVLDGLQPTDRLALVTYDGNVQVLVPAYPLLDKEAVRRAIRQIQPGGSTNLHGGWFKGAEELAPYTREDVTSRVILLSDGCANSGLTDPAAIQAQCAEFARAGISTSTYGLGRNFNEDLMIGMARSGQGNTYYGETADDLLDPFREEFELLNALCARRLRLSVTAAPGVEVGMLNDYVADGEGAWLLPSLAFGGEAWAVLRAKVPRGFAGGRVLSATVAYTTLDGEAGRLPAVSLDLPVMPASAFNAIAEDELVVRRADELEAAGLQVRAREAARRGDWERVSAVLARVERIAERNEWVRDTLQELRALEAKKDDVVFAKESAFLSRRMSSRMVARDESADYQADLMAPSYLQRKAKQGKAEKR